MMSPEDRLWAKVDKTDTCWNWTGRTVSGGYGVFGIDNKTRVVHRFSYELTSGPIVDGMQIDHMCHNTRCVNPEHLRQVTPKQNVEHRSGPISTTKSGFRGVSWHKGAKKWQAQVGHNGDVHHLGYFTDPAEAGAAAEAKRLELFTHNDLDKAA